MSNAYFQVPMAENEPVQGYAPGSQEKEELQEVEEEHHWGEGFDSGFSEGYDKGTEEGYDEGYDKCAQKIDDLKDEIAEYRDMVDDLRKVNI